MRHAGARHAASAASRTCSATAAAWSRPGDDAALRRVLDELLDDPAQRAALGAAGRARCEREYDGRRQALRFAERLRSVARGRLAMAGRTAGRGAPCCAGSRRSPAAAGVVLALQFVTIAVLAGHLGPADLGVYTFALAVVGIFRLIPNFGLVPVLTREIAQDPEREAVLVPNVLYLRVVLGVVAYALLAATVVLGGFGAESRDAALIAGLVLLVVVDALRAVLEVRLRLGWVSIAELVEAAAGLVGAVLLARAGAGPAAFVWLWAALKLVNGCILTGAAMRMGRFRWGAHAASWGPVVRAAVPLGLAGVLMALYHRLDLVLLAAFKPADDVGQYGAAFRFLDAANVLPVVVMSVLSPVLSRSVMEGAAVLHRRYAQALELLVAAALLIGVAGAFCAWRLLPLLPGLRGVRRSRRRALHPRPGGGADPLGHRGPGRADQRAPAGPAAAYRRDRPGRQPRAQRRPHPHGVVRGRGGGDHGDGARDARAVDAGRPRTPGRVAHDRADAATPRRGLVLAGALAAGLAIDPWLQLAAGCSSTPRPCGSRVRSAAGTSRASARALRSAVDGGSARRRGRSARGRRAGRRRRGARDPGDAQGAGGASSRAPRRSPTTRRARRRGRHGRPAASPRARPAAATASPAGVQRRGVVAGAAQRERADAAHADEPAEALRMLAREQRVEVVAAGELDRGPERRRQRRVLHDEVGVVGEALPERLEAEAQVGVLAEVQPPPRVVVALVERRPPGAAARCGRSRCRPRTAPRRRPPRSRARTATPRSASRRGQ